VPLVHGAHAPGGTDATGWLLVALLVLVPSIAYLSAARARRAAGRNWPARRAAGFILGLVLVAVAASPGMHELGRHDPRGHVIQHLLLGMFAPFALVLAAPVTLLLSVLPVPCRGTARSLLRSRALHGLAHPATAGVLDMGGLYLLYLTPLYTFTTTNALAHHVVNLHFLLAGYLFTWSIAGPDPAPRRPAITIRALVLIAAGAAHAYLAKLLYARAPELPRGSSHDLGQVQAAAQLMYYGGDLAELALAVALFATWYRIGRAVQTENTKHGLGQDLAGATRELLERLFPDSDDQRTSSPGARVDRRAKWPGRLRDARAHAVRGGGLGRQSARASCATRNIYRRRPSRRMCSRGIGRERSYRA
jgi:putative membrane protein